LGRPPAADSAETRARIIDVARQVFAEHGYDGATNRFIATKAGITTAALYHYFDAKIGLYKAVYAAAQDHVYEHFEAAAASGTSFVGRVRAVMDSAHEINRRDPSLARFLASARIDLGRHDDLRTALSGEGDRGRRFMVDILEQAVADGEIPRERQAQMMMVLRTILMGLSDSIADDLRTQRMAMDGILEILEASFPPPGRSAAGVSGRSAAGVSGRSAAGVSGRSAAGVSGRSAAGVSGRSAAGPRGR
jgi:AcrR family transcriptional regulator